MAFQPRWGRTFFNQVKLCKRLQVVATERRQLHRLKNLLEALAGNFLPPVGIVTRAAILTGGNRRMISRLTSCPVGFIDPVVAGVATHCRNATVFEQSCRGKRIRWHAMAQITV